jgi:hypothetical protein
MSPYISVHFNTMDDNRGYRNLTKNGSGKDAT